MVLAGYVFSKRKNTIMRRSARLWEIISASLLVVELVFAIGASLRGAYREMLPWLALALLSAREVRGWHKLINEGEKQ